MNKEHSLEEDAWHGTVEKPLVRLHFSPEHTPQYADGFFVERHWHHEVELLHIRKGTFRMELNLENMILREGDFCFVNSGELHRLDGCHRGTVHDAVIFNPYILKFAYHDVIEDKLTGPILAGMESLPHMVRVGEDGYGEIKDVFEQLCRFQYYPDDVDYLETKLNLYRLLFLLKKRNKILSTESVLSAAEKEKIDRYKRIVTYVQEHFAEKVTLDDMAGQVQCNPQYLCHFFKEIAGVPPIQYLISHRLERAKEMLRDTTKPVLEISLDCGFDNVSYFIRQFKKEEGVTPREYRGKSRAREEREVGRCQEHEPKEPAGRRCVDGEDQIVGHE